MNGRFIPDALRQLLDRLLAKEPSLRPDSAARVAVALQAIEAQLATCPEAAAHTGALGSPGEPPLGEKVRPFAGAPDSSDQFGAGSPIFSEIAAEADRARRRSRRQTIAVGIVALLCAAGIGISVWAFMSIETPTEPPPGVVAAGDEPSRAARGEGAAEKDVARAPLTPAEPVSVAAVPAPAAEPGERQGASPPASGAAPDAGTSPVADAAAEAVVEPEDAGSRSDPDPGAPAAEAASPVLLDSKPPGAAVLVGGKRIGSTPMTLSVGQGEPLKVLLLRSGHYPANVELTRSPARRLIRLRPRDVHIEVP